jgi:hypothetical protein
MKTDIETTDTSRLTDKCWWIKEKDPAKALELQQETELRVALLLQKEQEEKQKQEKKESSYCCRWK